VDAVSARRSAVLAAVQERLGYNYADQGLFRTALVHRSYANEHPGRVETNERLEFLGDAILAFVAADYLFSTMPRASEGELTRYRAGLVNRRTLAAIARDAGVSEAVLLGKGERAAGGHHLDSILSDTWEALLGAAYLDGGIEASAVIFQRGVDRVLHVRHGIGQKDPKSALQEITQRRFKETPTYVHREGPPQATVFRAEVHVRGESLGEGEGATKGEAEQNAARVALTALETAR
jgi:ribonuclease-3